VNRVVLNLLNQCRHSNRFQPLLIESTWDRPEPFAFERLGYPAVQVRLRPPMENGTLREILIYVLFLPSEMRRLLRVFVDHRVEVFNIHFATNGPLTILLMKKLGLWQGKLIISLHGTDLRQALRSTGLKRWLTKWVFRNADAVVTCSRSMISDVLELDPCLTNCHAILNGVDTTDAFQSDPVALREPGTELIVSIGRFALGKAHEVLIAAFRKVAEQRPQARLWIIGSEGDALANTRTLVDGDERIRLFLDVPHARAMATIAQAAVFAFSSRLEGLPLAILEAAQLGLPVVSTRYKAAKEIIPNQDFGRLVAIDDISELAAAMGYVLEHCAEAREMGNRLRERVASEFSWEKTWLQYESLV
jgi:glycosyltransferase involved in cell wall biosynthesis